MSAEYEPWVDQWPEAVDAVMEFWYRRREWIAKRFECEPKEVDPSAVWFLVFDPVLPPGTVERAKEIATELGLSDAARAALGSTEGAEE